MTTLESSRSALRAPMATASLAVLVAVSFCHLLNDVMQSLLVAVYPILKHDYALTFWQIGLLTMAFQVTASLLQPFIGYFTDKRPVPYSTTIGMGSTFVGLLMLAFANSYASLIMGAACVGIGSAIFHPESSRIARLASGGRHGFAQSLFQLGGNFGTAIGPLLAAFIVLPRGQQSLAWFGLIALVGMAILWKVSQWAATAQSKSVNQQRAVGLLHSRRRTAVALTVLTVLVFSKNVYMASITSYYTFYAIHRFGVSVQTSQLLLFAFLGASAVGTILGGLFGDRFGAKTVIWFSILGCLPFTLALPYADFNWTIALSVLIGLILSSAFPAIVVFAQELVPGRVGMIAGIFFGFAFGMGGIGAAILGIVADARGIDYVYEVCSYLPFLGLLTVFLPRSDAPECDNVKKG
ncbi:MFS transporter [Hyphomicrobium sp.]|uniref:MFS transporter n=1 Tax=Hyphomicrobium sp. TaxID=82 RepID=UPI000FA29F8D|nr:MFS transporter [Hyphomicrobium sp.]RUP10985.1 MAG: MFS transporter [Hyphomicrobium sp.]